MSKIQETKSVEGWASVIVIACFQKQKMAIIDI